MKTAASLLSQEQLLVSPTSAFPSTRRAPPLLLVLTVMEMSTAQVAKCQDHHHAERALVGAGALSWFSWAVELCWQLSDWAAICCLWPNQRRVSNHDGRVSSIKQEARDGAPAPQLADCSGGKARWNPQCPHYLSEAYPPRIHCCLYHRCQTATPPAHCCAMTVRSCWSTTQPHRPHSPVFNSSIMPSKPQSTH